MRESSITRRTLQTLRARGFWALKVFTGAYGRKGMPDVYAIGPKPCPSCGEPVPGCAFHFEVKRPGQRSTAIQRKVQDELRAAGAEVMEVHGPDELP